MESACQRARPSVHPPATSISTVLSIETGGLFDTPEGQVVHIDDFALQDVTLAFDEGRKLYEIRSAKLSEEKSVGMDRFPPGTEINLNSRQIRGEYPGPGG